MPPKVRQKLFGGIYCSGVATKRAQITQAIISDELLNFSVEKRKGNKFYFGKVNEKLAPPKSDLV